MGENTSESSPVVSTSSTPGAPAEGGAIHVPGTKFFTRVGEVAERNSANSSDRQIITPQEMKTAMDFANEIKRINPDQKNTVAFYKLPISTLVAIQRYVEGVKATDPKGAEELMKLSPAELDVIMHKKPVADEKK